MTPESHLLLSPYGGQKTRANIPSYHPLVAGIYHEIQPSSYGRLVVFLEHDFCFSIQLGIIIIPTDELIFFRWVGIPPTSISYCHTKCVFHID